MRTIKITPRDPMLDIVQSFSALQVLLLSVPSLELGGSAPRYLAQLKEFWDGPCPQVGAEHKGSSREVFIALQQNAAQAQARWLREHRQASAEQAEQLENVLSAKDGKGCHNVCISAGKRVIRLPLNVLISPETLSGSSEFSAWLMSTDSTLRKFGSERSLREELARQMLDPEKRQALVSMLSASEQASLKTHDGLWTYDRFSLEPCKGGVFEARVKRLLDAQSDGVQHLIYAESTLSQDACERLARLNGFAQAQATQLEKLLDQHRRIRQPQWLKSADAESREEFFKCGKQLEEKRVELDTLMAEMMTPESFAQHILGLELSALGITLDPSKVQVNVAYDFEVNGRTLNYQKTVTLVQLAMNDHFDRPAMAQTTLGLNTHDLEAGLTEEIVRVVIEAHDIRGDYTDALRQRYASPEVGQAMQELLEARLALALIAARMQGHITNQGYTLLDALRQSAAGLEAQRCGIHWVSLNNGSIPLTDVMVVSYAADDGDQFLLYAPGAPSGQDIQTFNHLTALRNELGLWISSEAGRNYLLGQVLVTSRAALSALLETLRLKPSLIDAQTLHISSGQVASWPDAVNSVCRRQADLQVAEVNGETPTWYLKAGMHSRRYLTRLDAELQALNQEYVRITQIPRFEDFSRTLLQDAFDAYTPKYRARIDVDQHQVELQPGQWLSLVDVAMAGVDYGVDVTRLRVSGLISMELREIIADMLARFLREHDAPTAYTRAVESAFMKKDSPDREWRQDVHFRINQLEMQRARLIGSMNRSINAKTNVFLMALVNNLDQLKGIEQHPERITQSGLYAFGVKGERVQGVYVFREKIDGGYVDTLYTPNAPDGIGFRDIKAFASSIEHGGMGPYYRERVPFNHLPRFDRFLQKLEDAGYSSQFTESRVGPFWRIEDFRAEHDRLIRAVLADVDASTTSKGERISKLVIERALTALSIALLPFPPAQAVLGAVLVTRSLILGVQAYQRAEHAVAAWHLLDAALGVASLAGVAGRPKQLFMEALFKGSPPKLVDKMVSQLQGKLSGQLRGYLESITVPEPDPRYRVR